MSDIAIRIQNLGKTYNIGKRERYKSLRDTLSDMVSTPFRQIHSILSGANNNSICESIWAIKDVSFEVNVGEVVGVIGRNGAGKSTLLKILSRITEPTTGKAEIHGRVGSLLEVGTGFHPELTGRENVYFNGSILGMRKAEIDARFDEIVAFAEIEKFVDTPVKHYSSGMQMRLAFSVAAHLENDILIVDEVLAVGDMAFQKKCLSKMNDAARSGCTVLLVSHNMAAIQALSTRAVLLDCGRVAFIGDTASTIHTYSVLLRRSNYWQGERIRGLKILALRLREDSQNELTPSGPLRVNLDFFTEYRLPHCYLNLVIENADGEVMIHSRTDACGLRPSFNAGLHRVFVEIPHLSLRSGVYSLWFRLYSEIGGSTSIVDSERLVLSVSGAQVAGAVDVPCQWSWSPITETNEELVKHES